MPAHPSAAEATARGIAMSIRTAREAANVSAEDLALACGLSKHTVWQWERGQRVPSLSQLIQISWALGVSLGWLLEGM